MIMSIMLKAFHAVHSDTGLNDITKACEILNDEYKGDVAFEVSGDNQATVTYIDDDNKIHVATFEIEENGEVSIGEEFPSSYTQTVSMIPAK